MMLRSLNSAIPLLLCAAVSAQLPLQLGPRRQVQEEEARARLKALEDQRNLELRAMFPYNAMPQGAPLPFHFGYQPGLQEVFPNYRGLPTYPRNVPGYGGYPGAAKRPNELQRQPLDPGMLPKDDKNRWPSWIAKGTGREKTEATAQQSVLVRITDRVWIKDPGEPAFIPLAFYDRFRFLRPGSLVDVRGKGEYQVVTHDGGGLRSRGPCRLAVTAMGPKQLAMELTNINQMWITAKLRPVILKLPDATEIEFANGDVYLDRRGDRCRVANGGVTPVKFRGPAGTGQLRNLEYLTIWMKPAKTAAFADRLKFSGDVSITQDKGITNVRGGAAGRVVWSGARFKVESGATLRLQPLPPVVRTGKRP